MLNMLSNANMFLTNGECEGEIACEGDAGESEARVHVRVKVSGI